MGHILRRAGVLACTFAFSHAASAADSTIEEVVVTAEKRVSTVQETPIAITAYDEAALDRRGIETVEDLQFSAPNLVISHNSQSPVTYAYIRGIGSDQLVAGFDPGVAYHVDGVYVGQPSSMPGNFWDMERIEVLRGPQGTLYGRNTTGGSINVITRDPEPGFEANGDVLVGDYGRKRVRVALGGGSETVSARLAVLTDSNDGFQENLVGPNGDVIDHTSVRGKLKFAIGDRGELVLTAQRFDNKGRQSQRRREPFAPVELAPGFILNVYDGAIPNPSDPRVVAKDHPEKLDLTNDFLSARLKLDFDGFSLVSITGSIKNKWFQTSDIDMSSNPVQYQDWDMDTDQFTQEFQLVSNGESPLEWIIGVFYFDEDLTTDYLFEDSSIAGFTFHNGGRIKTKSQAVFGQASYDFSDSGTPIRVVAGLRWTRDEKGIDEFQQIPQFAVDLSGQMNNEWKEVTGKLGVDWFVNDDTMAYLSLSRGYKGGGYSVGQFDAFDPEKVNSIEVGLKTRFWDQRAQVNVAAFTNDYKDLQVNFLQFTSFTTDNAAEATIQGIEVESVFLPIDNLTVGLNFTWLDATFDRYQFSPTIDLSGTRLNRAPKNTVNLSLQYEWPLGSAGSLQARGDYYWQDAVYYRVQNIPRHRADSFGVTDLGISWFSANDAWKVDAFVKNVSDGDHLRSITVSDGLSTGNNTFESYYPPRTVGLTVAYRMGD